MAKQFPHLVFGLIYFSISFCVSVLLSGAGASQTESVLQQIAPLATAPLALLAALRLGVISKVGVAATSLLVELASYVAIWAIFHSLAVPVGGSVSFFAPAQLGGWLLALNVVIFVLSPVVWLHLIGRQQRQRPATNVAA